eukprot:TRINITY_DN17855_c0_g1_i1.p1 TRINITY_DN17855_c0_g1~~TRINITY_DN17855_c0_g1_i1.p1  ORF type:complete len:680 (+),score=90.89 TRINITY_DN17855_c0_g1_i1:140-2041(+)
MDLSDFQFSYEPFVGRLPVFVDERQRTMWEAAHDKELKDSESCAKFIPSKLTNREIVFCNASADGGRWSDLLLVRENLQVPLDADDCSRWRQHPQEQSPEPSGRAGTDLISYDSWSFQHFLDGPALRIAQNFEYYVQYNATILADIRENTGSYNNPLVPKMLEQAGLGAQTRAHCSGWNNREPCIAVDHPDLALGCSSPPEVPELAVRFRQLMGVSETLAEGVGGVIVFAPHLGSQANNPGRNFVNNDEVRDVVKHMAEEFGHEFADVEAAVTGSVQNVTDFWGKVKMLVAAHGGAMYNMWFMPQRAGVIEIQGDDGKGSSYFYKKAAMLSHVYAPLYSEMVGGTDAWRTNMKVNVSELKSLMRRVLCETSEGLEQCSESADSLSAGAKDSSEEEATSESPRASVTVMLCQSAQSAERLRLLREAWLDDALRNERFASMVFVPRGAAIGEAGYGLDVMELEDWHGDQNTFQAALSRAIVPCAAKASADFYAVLDDDVVLHPSRLLEWAHTLPAEPAVWGREACCGIVYGGLMLVTESAVKHIVQDFEGIHAYVSTEVIRRNFVVYKPAPYNVDHFFPLAVQRIEGGVVHETDKIRDLDTSTSRSAHSCVFPSGVVALHHIKSEDFTAFIGCKA